MVRTDHPIRLPSLWLWPESADSCESPVQGRAGELIKVMMPRTGQLFLAIVPADDSEARREGWDAMVMACGRKCKKALSRAGAAERSGFHLVRNDAV